MYGFTVNDEKKINLQRVVDENPDQDVIVVHGKGSSKALLMVHQRFLEPFQDGDMLPLGGERLYARWGYSEYSACYIDGHVDLWTSFAGHHMPYGWHCHTISFPDDMARISQELKAARAFERKIKVEVHLLGEPVEPKTVPLGELPVGAFFKDASSAFAIYGQFQVLQQNVGSTDIFSLATHRETNWSNTCPVIRLQATFKEA